MYRSSNMKNWFCWVVLDLRRCGSDWFTSGNLVETVKYEILLENYSWI